MSERVKVEVEGGQPEQKPGGGGMGSFLMMIPGLSLVGFGVAIIQWPQILVYTVATVFILLGLGLSFAARKVGRWRKKASGFEAMFSGQIGGRPPGM